jgi:hypothetical protein
MIAHGNLEEVVSNQTDSQSDGHNIIKNLEYSMVRNIENSFSWNNSIFARFRRRVEPWNRLDCNN